MPLLLHLLESCISTSQFTFGLSISTWWWYTTLLSSKGWKIYKRSVCSFKTKVCWCRLLLTDFCLVWVCSTTVYVSSIRLLFHRVTVWVFSRVCACIFLFASTCHWLLQMGYFVDCFSLHMLSISIFHKAQELMLASNFSVHQLQYK